jgi:hypothetical protein
MVGGAAAKELSPQDAEARAQAMFEVEQRIKDAFAQGRAAMWDAAKAMHEFDQENGWTALGYEKLGDWLADPGIQMTRATYYRWVGTYRKLLQRKVDESELRELDVSKVDIVLGAVEAGRVELDDALADVKELGARDLRDRYIQRPDPAKAVPPVEDDDPPNVETDDEVPYDPPPVNTGDDAPVKASEAEPAQNTDDGASGQDQPDEVEEVDAEPVNPVGPSAAQVVAQLDEALDEGGRPTLLKAVSLARMFIVDLFPDAAPNEDA